MTAQLDAAEKRFVVLQTIYEDLYKDTAPKVFLDGVVLKEALVNQISLQMDWELLVKKINKVYDVCENEAEIAYSAAISVEMKNAYKTTTITEAREFAKADPTYQRARRLLIEVREVRDEARGILSTIESRKYILNNITNAVVASVETHII